ncbi:alpha/beta hydrolase [Streptomyces sp. WMMC500]|uniref:alpha/beta fold hydrolase n=1 Tax=Streptomyces sp. WMMC500 TaxID=3015154 RepID=UPI00248B14E9|nr:alpha/beta hydrolase [Streptomyces sp. WMMC500]WBB61528.1 alpha/beta hydrolase [Streptomyces sp. WMMC500]
MNRTPQPADPPPHATSAAPPDAPAGLTYVRAGQVELCVRDAGAGPAVVLLHGTTATLGVWDPVVERLGGTVRTVAVDQRGHGRSGRPAAGYDAAAYTADLHALIRALDCGPVVAVGHSLGARNAVVLAAAHPGLVAGVVAVDYAPYVEPAVLDALETRVRGGDRAFASGTDVETYLRERYPLLPADAVRRRRRYGYAPAGAGPVLRPLADPAAMVRTVEGLRRDFDAETRAVRVPVTLLRGEHSAVVSPRAFAATRELRPDFRAVELSGLDHYVPEEDPHTVADEIVRMLDRTTGRPRPRPATERT